MPDSTNGAGEAGTGDSAEPGCTAAAGGVTGASADEDAVMEEEKEEWDGPWKEALDSLELVFELFWPDVPGEVDLARRWTSLEQELQKLTPDSSSGLLRVDKLFELVAKGSGDPRFAHFEAQ